jgi:hypothetical protein
VTLLKEDEADQRMISSKWPVDQEHPAQLLSQLVFFIELTDGMTPKDFTDGTKVSLGLTSSAFQDLAGNRLPTIFKRHFHCLRRGREPAAQD